MKESKEKRIQKQLTKPKITSNRNDTKHRMRAMCMYVDRIRIYRIQVSLNDFYCSSPYVAHFTSFVHRAQLFACQLRLDVTMTFCCFRYFQAFPSTTPPLSLPLFLCHSLLHARSPLLNHSFKRTIADIVCSFADFGQLFLCYTFTMCSRVDNIFTIQLGEFNRDTMRISCSVQQIPQTFSLSLFTNLFYSRKNLSPTRNYK